MRKNKKNKNKKDFKMPVKAVIDNIIFTDKAAWAYFVLADQPYDFLDFESKLSLANATQNALASLVTSSDKIVDCHLLISNTVFSVSQWEEQYRHNYLEWNKHVSKPFEKFIEEQKRELKKKSYKKRITFLGVKLYNRGSFDFGMENILDFGFKEAWQSFKKATSNLFKIPGEEITTEEEERARITENSIYTTLSEGTLQARRPSAEELLLTLKRRFYPAMPTPYLETSHTERLGLADIIMETGGTVEVFPRYLKMTNLIDGEEMTGYRSTLSFSKFPDSMFHPSGIPPFFYRREILPFTCNARFSLIPNAKMSNEVNSKKQILDDEIKNLEESGQRAPAGVIKAYRDSLNIEEELSEARFPWVSGSYSITVEARTPEELNTIVSNIKQNYSESEILLSWTSGDQLPLFRQELFGNPLEIGSFVHTTNIAMLTAAGFNFGGTVGDPIGGF